MLLYSVNKFLASSAPKIPARLDEIYIDSLARIILNRGVEQISIIIIIPVSPVMVLIDDILLFKISKVSDIAPPTIGI